MPVSPPRFTIGIPVYNGEKYLREAIQSALAQDHLDFEVIVSDNASTDRTEEICREFSGNPKFRYFRHERNLGPTGNFEFTLTQSSAKYFKWLAHDDFCSPQLLSSVDKIFAADPSVVCAASNVRVVDAAGTVVRLERLSAIGIATNWSDARRLFFEFPIFNLFHAIYGVFRRDVLAKLVFERGVLHPSYRNFYTNSERYFLACIATCGRIVAIDEPLLSYRIHVNSLFHEELRQTSKRDQTKRDAAVRLQLVRAAWYSDLALKVRLELALRAVHGIFQALLRRAQRLIDLRPRENLP